MCGKEYKMALHMFLIQIGNSHNEPWNPALANLKSTAKEFLEIYYKMSEDHAVLRNVVNGL